MGWEGEKGCSRGTGEGGGGFGIMQADILNVDGRRYAPIKLPPQHAIAGHSILTFLHCAPSSFQYTA